jgi:ferritin-like metal-binding protein YciE
MKLKHPTDLFFDQLRDLYSVESQVILTLPHLAAAASHPDLRRLLAGHEKQSEQQKNLLLSLFERCDQEPNGDICKAMKGLIEGGNEHLARTEDSKVRDLLVIAHCNRIKYYEIAGYGFAMGLAECIGLYREAEVLAAILDEEKGITHRLAACASNMFGPCMTPR